VQGCVGGAGDDQGTCRGRMGEGEGSRSMGKYRKSSRAESSCLCQDS